jgi:type IV pilus assembly protein PilB
MLTPLRRADLLDLLVARTCLTSQQAQACAEQATARALTIPAVLLADGLLSESSLAEALAEQYGLPYDGLEDYRLDLDVFHHIPVEWMHRHPFVPLKETDGILTIAVCDPHDVRALDDLEFQLNCECRVVVSTRTAILQALSHSEGNSQVITRIQEEFRPVLVRETEQGDEVLSVEKIAKDQSPVVKLVDTIILSALQKRASDIHIEVSEQSVDVKYRIDGMLYPAMDPLDVKFHSPLISRLKIMS